MNLKNKIKIPVSILLSLVLTICVIPASPLFAFGEYSVYNLNMTLSGDSSTSIHFNWKTERTTSSTLPQPRTALVYCTENETLTKTSHLTMPVSVVYDRTSYFKVSLTGLAPDTTYHYAVLNLDTNQLTAPSSFKTASAGDESFSFLSFADAYYRTTATYANYWGETLDGALEKFPDTAFVMHTGDFGSAEDETHMNGFFSYTSTVFPHTPVVPLPVSDGSLNRWFSYNFNLDAVSDYDTGNYSFVYGNALILALNTNLSSSSEISSTSAWIRDEITQKGSNKWIIAAIGDSFYGGSLNISSIKQSLEQVFEETGVSLVIQGGDYNYVRSYLIHDTNIVNEYPSETVFSTDDGLIYLTPGSAGAELDHVSSSAEWVSRTFDYDSSDESTALENKGYSRIEVSADAITVSAYTMDDRLFDSFEINRFDTPPVSDRSFEPYALNNAFGDDPKTSRKFTWQTNEDNQFEGAFVEITNTKTNEKQTIFGTSDEMEGHMTDNTYHKVTVSDLAPGTVYHYQAGTSYYSTNSGITYRYLSDMYSFQTAPQEEDSSFTFIHFADSQSGSSYYTPYWGNTLETALAQVPNARFMIHTGDMIDSVSTSQWTAFFDAVNDKLSSAAFMPVLGNHEGSSSVNEAFYETIFNVKSENSYPLNYYFVYGNALFINLNSCYDESSDLDKQAAWLRDIAAENAEDKFMIVSFHKAPFGALHAGDSDVIRIKNQLVPVLEELDVDLVLQGHDHNYIRSYPIKNGVPNTSRASQDIIHSDSEGIVFMVTRNSGEKTYAYAADKPWMDVRWNAPAVNSPDDTTFAAITVDDDSIDVTVYTCNPDNTPDHIIDSYSIMND